MRLLALGFACAGVGLSGPSAAFDLTLPGEAELVREVDREADTYFLPTGRFTEGRVPSQELEGRVVRQAWRITGEDISTLGLLSAIREQVQSQGFELLLDCTTQECGGFDFRFGIDVLPAPDMFVDLFDFRFLSAKNDMVPGAQYMSALVSRAGQVGYIQLVLTGAEGVTTPTPEPAPEPEVETSANTGATQEQDTVASSLTGLGHAVLSDLVFATGSSTLEDGSYTSLSELAAFLKSDPALRVVLVGHTDAVGGLDSNLALSRERAASVMQSLMQDHDVPADQLDAQGMGYLAPVGSNATEEGRRANRRVEAVLLNTE